MVCICLCLCLSRGRSYQAELWGCSRPIIIMSTFPTFDVHTEAMAVLTVCTIDLHLSVPHLCLSESGSFTTSKAAVVDAGNRFYLLLFSEPLQRQIVARLDCLTAGHTSVFPVTPCLEMHQHIPLPWLLL